MLCVLLGRLACRPLDWHLREPGPRGSGGSCARLRSEAGCVAET